MKAFLTALLLLATLSLSAKATFCNEDGSYCKEVSKVLQLEPSLQWVEACCWNVHIPLGHNCEDDCSLAKQGTTGSLQVSKETLEPSNAYILFKLGYRAWVLIDGNPDPNPKIEISVEIVREYLPAAQQVFLKDENIAQIAFTHAKGIEIVVQRPAKESDLQKEIVFTDWERLRQAKVEHLAQEVFDQSISVSPNPARSTETISIKFGQVFAVERIEICSSNGSLLKTLKKEDAKAKIIELDLNLIQTTDRILILKIIGAGERVFIRKLTLTY